MSEDKYFLTYNQQMRKLRNVKHIDCGGSNDKQILVRSGYFNIINGYKSPFVCDTNSAGEHIYLPGTSIGQMQTVKKFDDELRSFLLKYITQIEEEVRALAAYKFDECNDGGKTPWYNPEAYNPRESLQEKMKTISGAYNELGRSKLEYVKFYMENHQQIPTWIMMKVVNFSTFISLLQYSKKDVPYALCRLYEITDEADRPNMKLLIGSLHWMRTVRNSCAHNERIYCISRGGDAQHNNGRIREKYMQSLRPSYCREAEQKLFDLFVYFKYYLPEKEYKVFISTLSSMLYDLKNSITSNAFDYVRGKIGIKDLDDLAQLKNLPKERIEYNHFSEL